MIGHKINKYKFNSNSRLTIKKKRVKFQFKRKTLKNKRKIIFHSLLKIKSQFNIKNKTN